MSRNIHRTIRVVDKPDGWIVTISAQTHQGKRTLERAFIPNGITGGQKAALLELAVGAGFSQGRAIGVKT